MDCKNYCEQCGECLDCYGDTKCIFSKDEKHHDVSVKADRGPVCHCGSYGDEHSIGCGCPAFTPMEDEMESMPAPAHTGSMSSRNRALARSSEMLDFIKLVASGTFDPGALCDEANGLLAKWAEKPVKTLFCPWTECQYSWCSDQPPENWEHCPRCRASFSFNKPTVK